MPNQPKTPTRTIRVSEDLWTRARAKANEQGVTLTSVIVDRLLDFVNDD